MGRYSARPHRHDEQWQREIERQLQIPHRYHVVAALAEAPKHLTRLRQYLGAVTQADSRQPILGEVMSTGRILELRSFGWVKLHGDGGLDTQLMRTLPG
ncbi:hypothetical protein GFY24_10540 [Nocardia sp. SYP-A9097]|nr:hypothetical protein [Nocardia sp. SYP-A9097]